MKIYTKKGDKGETSLIGGKRVKKHNIQVEAYGTVDELQATIGLIIDFSTIEEQKALLSQIQIDLFTIGSHIANSEKPQKSLTPINNNPLDKMVWRQDIMNDSIPPLTHFILPGGHKASSFLHLGRTICRRAERRVTALDEANKNNDIVKYLNRLSDYLFCLARLENHNNNIEEIKWVPEKS